MTENLYDQFNPSPQITGLDFVDGVERRCTITPTITVQHLAGLGMIPRMVNVTQFGRAPLVSSLGGAPQDVWSLNTVYRYLGDTPLALQVKSSAAGDADGTANGVTTVRVCGLDAAWLYQIEDVVLNGLTPVPLTKSFVRVYCTRCIAGVAAVGNAPLNQGDITVETVAGAVPVSHVPQYHNRSQQSNFTTAANQWGEVYQLKAADMKQEQAGIALSVREYGGLFETRFFTDIYQNSINLDSGSTLFLPPKTDVRVLAFPDGNNQSISAWYHMLLVRDDSLIAA